MDAWVLAACWAQTESAPTVAQVFPVALTVLAEAERHQAGIRAVLTTGVDRFTQPPDSVLIADALGASTALTASVNNSCASVVSAIDLCAAYIQVDEPSCAIVTASSGLATYRSNPSATHEVNGVGALLVGNISGGLRIVSSTHFTDARFHGLKVIQATGCDNRPQVFCEDREHALWKEYRERANSAPIAVMNSILRQNHWTISEVDSWVLHQSELTDEWVRRLGIASQPIAPRAGSVSCIAQLERILMNKHVRKHRVAVLEIGLGLTVSAMLLETVSKGEK